jgi:uncharacterized repeat protein (TIGR03803 family)
VFKLDTSGDLTTLYTFPAASGGGTVYARGSLIRDPEGNIYGTTGRGGDFNDGSVFKLDPVGNFSILHSFSGADGESPQAALIRDAKGNLYGTTIYGGVGANGTVFKIDPSGHETVLYAFTGINGDGRQPSGTLVADAGGNVYSTTTNGGSFDLGTVFKLDRSGRETVLYSFNGSPDGAYPFGGLVFDAVGNLYGSTTWGGDDNCDSPYGAGCGTVFRLTAPPAVVRFTPSSGPVGTSVVITGANLAQTQRIGFGDQVPADFTIDSNRQITGTVPAGARTGKLGVQTPGGIALSRKIFTVKP